MNDLTDLSKKIVYIMMFYDEDTSSVTMDFLNICYNKTVLNSTLPEVNLRQIIYRDSFSYSLKTDYTLDSLRLVLRSFLGDLYSDNEVIRDLPCDDIFEKLREKVFSDLVEHYNRCSRSDYGRIHRSDI